MKSLFRYEANYKFQIHYSTESFGYSLSKIDREHKRNIPKNYLFVNILIATKKILSLYAS